MSRRKQNKVQNGQQIGCMLDKELNKKVIEYSAETGTSKAEITRRALRQFMADGQNEALIMLNLVMHIQTVRDMKDQIPKEQYEELMRYSDSILTLKGGDLNGYV